MKKAVYYDRSILATELFEHIPKHNLLGFLKPSTFAFFKARLLGPNHHLLQDERRYAHGAGDPQTMSPRDLNVPPRPKRKHRRWCPDARWSPNHVHLLPKRNNPHDIPDDPQMIPQMIPRWNPDDVHHQIWIGASFTQMTTSSGLP